MGHDGSPPEQTAAQPSLLEEVLTARRDQGHKLLVPYLTGGMDDQWPLALEAVAAAGADAVEIGMPFSDPMIDGQTIQEASRRALERATTPERVLAEMGRSRVGIPTVVMTYYNLVFRAGHHRMAANMAASGVSGAIIPDLPLEELEPWSEAATPSGVATVLLVAPSTPEERMEAICRRSRGFVYAVGRMGVTGEQAELAHTAQEVAARALRFSEVPVCVGIGVSTAEQAVAVCEVADGVVVGSALVRRLLDGGGPEAAAEFVSDLRRALDRG
ncbi:MAG: tryptophan synthase subunit alpha [Acidimicrobiales bacterium]